MHPRATFGVARHYLRAIGKSVRADQVHYERNVVYDWKGQSTRDGPPHMRRVTASPEDTQQLARQRSIQEHRMHQEKWRGEQMVKAARGRGVYKDSFDRSAIFRKSYRERVAAFNPLLASKNQQVVAATRALTAKQKSDRIAANVRKQFPLLS